MTVLAPVLALLACSSQAAAPGAGAAGGAAGGAASGDASPSARAEAGVPAETRGEVHADAASRAEAEAPALAVPGYDAIAGVLFPGHVGAVGACDESLPAEARIRCLFDERYRGDTVAAGLAHELWVKWRVIAGVEVAHTMNGGYRGMIRIVPAVPIGAERKHLEWIVLAMKDMDAFFDELERHRAKTQAPARSSPRPARYRFAPITLRFMRSVAARTPSAYAHDWTVAWNLAGSLHTFPDAVRETLVHEIFHLNDYAHPSSPDEPWSPPKLGPTFDAVVKKCGTAIACLGPYTPNETIVRGGTYYSFQPGNGVREYAAELAVRYYREQRAALRGLPRPKPFKCGTAENARAWDLVRDEFFDGVDAVPPCSG